MHGRAVPACRCNGSTGRTSTSAASPALIVERHRQTGRCEVRVLPSGREPKVARIVTMDGDLDEAVAGQSVTLTLRRRDRLLSRGDVLAPRDALPSVADQFEATIVWMDDEPMLPGRPYWMKIGAQAGHGDDAPSRSTRSTSTRWSTSRRRRWSSTRSASATCRSTSRSRSSPYADNRDLGRLHPDRQDDERDRRRRA